jgi:hypothetical protein
MLENKIESTKHFLLKVEAFFVMYLDDTTAKEFGFGLLKNQGKNNP